MRILFVGVLDKEWSTNCSMKRVFEDAGHTVISFNYRTITENFKSVGSAGLPNKWLDKLASFLRSERVPFNFGWYYKRGSRKKMNALLLDKVKQEGFDLILLSKTDTVDPRLLTKINKYSPTWYFFMDPMDQVRRINAAAYAAAATWASATFSDVTEHFKKAGAQAYWITQGVDTEVFKPKLLPKIYDVVFVGTKTEKRLRYVNALRKAGVPITCFGQGWENDPIYQEELTDVYRKSRIVLNFCRPGSGFSIRVFQILGTETFLLSEYCPDLARVFERKKHIDWFVKPQECLQLVRDYLEKQNENKREEIAANGYNYVVQNYSWKNVIGKICEIIKTDVAIASVKSNSSKKVSNKRLKE